VGLFVRESRLPSVDDQAVVPKQFSSGLDDGGVDAYAFLVTFFRGLVEAGFGRQLGATKAALAMMVVRILVLITVFPSSGGRVGLMRAILGAASAAA
jgi:hypothetical protein